MNILSRFLSPLLALSVLLPSLVRAQSVEIRDKNVVAQLVSDQDVIAPGEPFTLGLRFVIDPTWHTYWINPGETGKTTELNLSMPDGFSAGPLQFPVPKRFVTDFGFNIIEAGFGYEGTVIHPITVTPPADLKVGDEITITAKADWLMCDPATCVPGSATFSITLPVAGVSEKSTEAMSIQFHQKKVPQNVDWATDLSFADGKVTVTVEVPEGSLPPTAKLHLHPYDNFIFDQLSEPEISRENGKTTFLFDADETLTEAPESFAGLLVAETDTTKTGFRVSMGDAGAPNEFSEKSTTPSQPTAETDALPFGGGLIGILFAAFLGGIILNIMPCVFPVISLKVMSFVGQAGEDRKKVLAHSLTFALGILVFFWILTTAMLVIRSVSGGDVGWGVQLQQPGFVVGLIFVMVVVAMSLFGVFELGTSMTSMGGGLANKSGYAGSFWSGALAVLLATPCTAPLMAPAIGFALSQSAPIMFLVFTTLGLGLAAPYFVFAIFPKLLDVIPPPGAWMETFKQFMGFPMLAVAVWLIGVLSKQLNVEGLQWSLAAVLFLAVAGWILGRFCGFDRSNSARMKGRVAAILFFALSIGVAWKATGSRAEASETDIREVIASNQKKGTPVFVDFTAEWCVTCKVNERTTIKTDSVQQLFKDNGVEFVIADWTNQDARITEVLKTFGRAGVPFYVLYPGDPEAAPITLGDGLITQGDIEEAIAKLPN
ncbi:MAG: thioredoxin family protein [Verrucomicrobiales bacterium]|nr:thioredoxin family protein [Verrucomicrobiales bacterium]